MSEPVLWHFPISHYNEKVRWALDWKRIPHRRRVLSADYLPRAWWATGRATLPVLHLEGRAIGDSTAIIAALEDHEPEPPLHPKAPEERARALAIEDWFDEVVGHPVRTLIVPALVESGGPERIAEVMLSGMSDGVKRTFHAIHPLFRRFYYWRHHIDPRSRAEAADVVTSGFDRVEAELQPNGYLVGDAFSVADLTAAALLAPIVRPAGTIWAGIGDLPPSLEAFHATIADRDATAWVHETYRRHRGTSFALRD